LNQTQISNNADELRGNLNYETSKLAPHMMYGTKKEDNAIGVA
jgi:hypothetical protein